MARVVGRLTALKVERLKAAGLYPDGAGLYLQVTGAGAKSWVYRFSLHGKAREMGLGSLGITSLAAARTKAVAARELRDQGIDPIATRVTSRDEARIAAARAMTFKTCASAYIEAHKAGWRNEKHISQWTNTLKTYAEPVLGALPVQAIDTNLVLKVIEPIWTTKPETASRLRGRIEAVLDWATARHYRHGDNPARWRGLLAKTLPARARVRTIKHHEALPFVEIPAFMAKLSAERGTAARALEFTILTAARTGESIAARPGEIGAREKSWVVPAERMKVRKEHRVPLSDAALALVRGANGEFAFPGHKEGKHLSNMAMLKLLDRMGHGELTVHGFRSTFRDWAAETTNYPREVVEMALAHTIGDKVEAAYRRGDLLEKRRQLMNDWARFCAGAS